MFGRPEKLFEDPRTHVLEIAQKGAGKCMNEAAEEPSELDPNLAGSLFQSPHWVNSTIEKNHYTHNFYSWGIHFAITHISYTTLIVEN